MSVASFCVWWHSDSVDMPTAPEKCSVDAKVCNYLKNVCGIKRDHSKKSETELNFMHSKKTNHLIFQ